MRSTEAMRLARQLLRDHGLGHWTVSFDRAKTRAGSCRFNAKKITLSGPLTTLHDEAEVRDTILHEIAHALVGPEHGHDATWRATALRIGASGERCMSSDAPKQLASWVGTCPAGHQIFRHRRPTRVASCPTCSPKFSVQHAYTWTHHGKPGVMSQRYLAEWRRLGAGGKPPVATATAVDLPLALGAQVRILAPGRYEHAIGIVEGIGRVNYQVAVPEGILVLGGHLLQAV